MITLVEDHEHGVEIPLTVTKEPVTDDERAAVTQDLEKILAGLATTTEEAILMTPREAFVMMVMLKENQDAIFEINKTL